MEARYKTHMGSDDLVVDAARVSFAKMAAFYTHEQNNKLIKYLATHDHWSPFGHPQIAIVEKVPIFVARQRFKHTVGFVYNEVSRRYVDDAPEFFFPSTWRKRVENKKQGSSNEGVEKQRQWEQEYENLIDHCRSTYEYMIAAGIAPEQARMVLPQSMYTEYMVTGSLAAWARAYKLRIDPHAQKEIQELAKEWDKIIRPLFPVAWSALVD